MAVLTALAMLGLSACAPEPKAKAFDTSFRTDDGGAVELLGAPVAAGDRGRSATAVVNGFELTDQVAPSAEAVVAEPAAAGEVGQGFQIVAAAPAAEDAPGAVPRATTEPRVEPPPAAEITAAAEAAIPEPAPRTMAARKAKPLVAVALMRSPAPQARFVGFADASPKGGRSIPQVEAAAAEPERPADGGVVMFAVCVLAAGALWRWHQACLKEGMAAVAAPTAPDPLLRLPAPDALRA